MRNKQSRNTEKDEAILIREREGEKKKYLISKSPEMRDKRIREESGISHCLPNSESQPAELATSLRSSYKAI